ncbi:MULTISPECIES: spore germination protein [unclassified Paenibacillus]|uniref:spore germination protein n=1 Tax=Paenibacillus TaxID=44249 RepID=UPI00089443E7|nr:MULTISPECIES: spore germination protein [unclassified Paenibacillus]PIH59317.1 spore germination protein [Paenibacillus sp. LK1]SEB02609.1 GerA spore germination protein [Paenibacillus sp. 276b]
MPLTTTPKKNPHLAEPFRINEHNLTTFFTGSDDVIISSHMIGESPQQIVIVYCSGMVDSKSIYDIILPELTRTYESTHFVRASDIEKSITLQWTSIDIQNNPLGKELMSLRVFEGHMLICIPSIQKMWSMDISNIPTRSPDESTTEVSIRGARDGFIERLSVNIALIRTRLRTAELACNIELIGSRSVTKVALMYIKDIANPELIDDVKNRLRKIDIERIMTANELEELLSPSKVTLFPVTHYTGRPDFAAECLLNGRFVIIVDGNPSVIIGPVNLFLLLKSPEDASFPFLPVNVGRMLRFIGLLITVFLPGFYIALTSFHMDQLPFPLVATISVGRMGLPMESGVEMFLIMLLMELFREAGVRLPSAIGQTLTVVGGLIIGDSAIRAGMVSPLMIVVIAVTVVAGATIVNQVMTSSVLILRFFCFVLGASLGIYGFILSIILFLIYLTDLKSFGIPYLTPLSPLNFRQALASLFKLPKGWMKRRPVYLETQEPRKEGNER